ncbi:ZNF839 family protein [Megaselia abdita]
MSNVILTKYQDRSGVYRFDSDEVKNESPVKVNNIVISKSPGKVIKVEHFQKIQNSFREEKEVAVQEEIGNVAIKHLKLSKRDRITVLSDENKIVHQTDTGQQTVYKITTPDDLGLTSEPLPIKKPKKLRQRKEKKTIIPTPSKEELLFPKSIRTRSGRLSKSLVPVELSIPEKQTFKELINDLKDTEYKCSNKLLETVPEHKEKWERKLPPDSKCPTCGKIFLGKRMLKHFLAHPDHKINPTSPPQKTDVYSFLVDKVRNSLENERTEVFLNEISNFVTKLQDLSSRLIHNTSGMHFVNQNSSKVLGIPEGCYSLDINALFSTDVVSEPELPEYNSLSNISLNLSSDHIPQSEESLLKTVDDLVKEGIKKLDNFDHHSITDNAVEAEVIMKSSKETDTSNSTLPPPHPSLMDLSLDVDMFQFKSPLKDL